jgi:hypothetical protein
MYILGLKNTMAEIKNLWKEFNRCLNTANDGNNKN